MSKRTVFTTITPLPLDISREVAVDFLHNHLEMIDLNPLVIERHPVAVPPHAPAEEARCMWYSLTDKISYLPGGRASGSVSYTCAFHNLPTGLQTHCYAPMGLDIRDKWTVCGSLPGERREPAELGIGAPLSGLYIREDVDMRCNVFVASFVKKTLKRAHASLVDHLKLKAQVVTVSRSMTSGSLGEQQQGRQQQQQQQQQRYSDPAGDRAESASEQMRQQHQQHQQPPQPPPSYAAAHHRPHSHPNPVLRHAASFCSTTSSTSTTSPYPYHPMYPQHSYPTHSTSRPSTPGEYAGWNGSAGQGAYPAPLSVGQLSPPWGEKSMLSPPYTGGGGGDLGKVPAALVPGGTGMVYMAELE